MSLSIVQQVARAFPELLETNLGSTCWTHTVYVIDRLRKTGHSAYHICKTRGEGQYTPPGFEPREITGFDGKKYLCTGVSHDAIWCDGLQFDTLAKANDSETPLFESDGRPMIAVPTWNAIPKEYWRPNNPPLLPLGDEPPVPQPKPARIPSYAELGDDAFFRASIGVPLQADMALAGQLLNDGSSVWFSRTTYEILAESFIAGHVVDPAPIVKKYRNQWRAILGLPPL